MAEPTNTPVPASTPRSATPDITLSTSSSVTSTPYLSVVSHSSASNLRPRVLHIGDPVKYNPATYASFSAQCDVVRPSTQERQRPEFIKALKEHRWGDFHAIFRPFWGTGGEMGNWDAELVSLLPPTVKVFASAGAGFDWADTELLGEHGIIYCNSGLAAAESVADFAVAMIISTFRHLPYCIKSATSKNEADFTSCHINTPAQSHTLRGRTLGLIGFGNIGQQIAARCRHGFGMNIHYYDIVHKPRDVQAAVQATAHQSLENLLGSSDCVVLCMPGTGDGSTIINAETLESFRRGSCFVNVARGSLVDEDALADAVDDGHLSAIALDVFANEPRISARLKDLAAEGRAMVTCHNAGGTVETHRGFEELCMRNIMAVLAGGKAITPVNMQHLRK